jgi:outer membrane protein insertion porin family
MRMSLFVDAGSLWGSEGGAGRYAHASDVRMSTGFSVNWASPIGPLAFVYGTPIIKKPGDRSQRLQFQIGSVF